MTSQPSRIRLHSLGGVRAVRILRGEATIEELASAVLKLPQGGILQ